MFHNITCYPHFSGAAAAQGNAMGRIWHEATEDILRRTWGKESPVAIVERVNAWLAERHPERPLHLRRTTVGGVWFAAHRLGFITDLAYLDYQLERRNRKHVPEQVRREVFARDGDRCLRCGSLSDLTVDHVTPAYYDGGNAPGHLQTLCRRCNQAKFVSTADYRGGAARDGAPVAEHATPASPWDAENMRRVTAATDALAVERDPRERHFHYNDLIEALWRLRDDDAVVAACRKELEEWPRIGVVLRSGDPNYQLPPEIPCRDRLVQVIIDRRRDTEAAIEVITLLEARSAIDRDGARRLGSIVEMDRLEDAAASAAEEGRMESARAHVEGLLALQVLPAATVHKWFAEHCLQIGANEQACCSFEAALAADPLLAGVKPKLRTLGRRLRRAVNLQEERAVEILAIGREAARRWQDKRDIAQEYVTLGLYGEAWNTFNEALILAAKERASAQSIYLLMARLAGKEERYTDAILYCALAHHDAQRDVMPLGSKRVAQCLTRCLKSGGYGVSTEVVLQLAKSSSTDRLPLALRQLLETGSTRGAS